MAKKILNKEIFKAYLESFLKKQIVKKAFGIAGGIKGFLASLIVGFVVDYLGEIYALLKIKFEKWQRVRKKKKIVEEIKKAKNENDKKLWLDKLSDL